MSRRINSLPKCKGFQVTYKLGWWIFATTYYAGCFDTFEDAASRVRELVNDDASRSFKIELFE